MSVGQIKPGASHPRTNEIIFALITGNISGESAVLDFGAGQGYMSQRIGQYFKDHGKSPRDHIHACEIARENFMYRDIDCGEISINSEIPFGDKQFDLI